jgi:ABC-2 type transport system permease protein
MDVLEALRDTFQIAKKDLTEFVRDRAQLISFIIMPIFMMVMMGYIFPSQNSLKNTPLGVINADKGTVAQNLVNSLKKMKLPDTDNKIFKIKTYGSVDQAKEGIKGQDINGAVVFPSDFSDKITKGEQTNVTLVTDQSNPQVSSLMTNMFTQVVGEMSSATGQKKVEALLTKLPVQKQAPGKAVLNINAKAIVKPFVLKTQGVVSGKPNYFQFMAPGIMGMVVIMAVMMGLAGSIAREKEMGTLDGILAAPIRRFSIIFGKTLSQTVRGLTQGVLVLSLAILLFGVKINGNPLLVVMMLILGIFSFVGLGILVSAAVSEQETAMIILMTLTFPMFFLSGTFFPIQQMPAFMQAISRILPMTYMVEALRKVVVLGATWPAIQTDVIVLFVFGLVTLIIAIPAFNRVITR